MDTRIAGGGGGEQPETFEEADATTVINNGNQKPFKSPSSVSSSSSVSSTSERAEPVIDSSNVEEEDESEWVAVEREGKAPEIEEVEEAFSALQLMFNDDDDDDDKDQVSELELVDWIEPPLQLCNTSLLQPYMLDRFYDAFHMFQTDPSVQRMVMSLASDRAVWDAVMNNEVVRELITNAERSEEEEATGISVNFIRRLLQRSAIKIMDAMEGVTKYVTDLFNGDETAVVPGDETVVLATGAAPAMEKLQMTVLLAIVVLLIVFVTRATRR